MKLTSRVLFRVWVCALCLNASCPAAAPKNQTFLTSESAPPSYRLQGEYEGTDEGGAKWGAQVVAQGAQDFQARLLPGGLPGAGWDGKPEGVVALKGGTDGSKLTLTPTAGGEAATASTADGQTLSVTRGGKAVGLKKVVRESPAAGAKPPEGAVVLFDGTNVDEWDGGKIDGRKLLAGGAKTKRKFRDFTLHVEFLLPYQPNGQSQNRGNSGVYIQERYEVQILDSFGLDPVPNGCAGLYKLVAPKLNMSYPPLTWQTYDIDFRAARFENGKKVKNAVISVRHNGVPVHENQEIPSKTGAGQQEGPEERPILLQAHGDPVFYRNVWVVENK